MADEILHEAALALKQDWELEFPDTLSEEEILRVLAERIVILLERGAEAFFQVMYRLDISEKKLNAVISGEDVPMNLARLIYERELQKIKSRHENRMKRTDDPELGW